ncbi:MAG: mechanosensitive ion channel [Clostridia bacterium]|nr:mechanosensitive ion channel [Clostridia bacterium]
MSAIKMLLTAGQDVNYVENTAESATNTGFEGFWGNLVSTVSTWVVQTGLRIVIALVLMFITFKIVSRLARKIEKLGSKPNYDKTLMRVLAYGVNIGGKSLILVCLIGFLGIDTSGITALIASLGVCVGLAVNGAVANIAGGVLLLVTRPFRVDDYIEAQGVSGTVIDIHLVNTKIQTPDNKIIYIPNGELANGNITNYSANDKRRVDLTFSISYDNNFNEAKAVIERVCSEHELILNDMAKTIRVSAHNQSSIDIATKVWVNRADYWTVYFDLLETVKVEFDKAGIVVPYNQLDVHVKHD